MGRLTSLRDLIGALSLLLVLNTQAAVQNPTLGNGLNGVVDWSTERPFKDIFKYSRNWLTKCDRGVEGCVNSFNTNEQHLLDQDAAGWVRSLPAPSDAPEFWYISTFWALTDTFPGGRYMVLYEGEGSIQYLGGWSLIAAESSPGRHVVDIHTPGNGLELVISATDPNGNGQYLKNIRVIPESYENSYQSQPFEPLFLDLVRPFHAQRFMDWMQTNNSPQSAWADRPQVSDARYSNSGGVPLEIMVDLVNLLDQHAWFTMPHQATDTYMQEFARLVLQRMDADQNVYVEYSNEVWNSMFTQGSYIENQGRNLWPGETDGFAIRLNAFGKRTAEMCNIWKQEWGSESHRVVCVMAAQAANSWVAAQSLACPFWNQGPCANHGIDAIAIAPYFGSYIGSPGFQSTVNGWTQQADGGLTTLFDEFYTGQPLGGQAALEQAYQWMDSNRQVASNYGLPMLAYEAGQHIVGVSGVENDNAITQLFMDANRDPRMGSTYSDYLNNWWSRGGDMLMHFVGIGAHSKWGSWGALEHSSQTSSPKYDALMSFLIEEIVFSDGMETP